MIVYLFGDIALEVIDKTPSKLREIEGIGKKKIESIKKHWNDQKENRDVMIFLRGHGIGPSLTKKIIHKYGDKCVDTVKNNPYAMTLDIMGVGFKTADQIAKKFGIENNNPLRVEAGIEFTLQELSEDGHVCYPEEAIINLAAEKLLVDQADINRALISLELKDRILRKPLPTGDLGEEELFVWLKFLFFAEVGISKQLKRLKRETPNIREIKIEKASDWVQEKLGIEFAKGQISALEKSFQEKVHVITGGPGTGKSTITRAILAVHERLTSNIILCAPTGKAAKRLSEITKRKASTIHSILEYDPTTNSFKRNQKNMLECDLIIIDEASMIDTILFYSLVRALPDGAKVICIGDIDQLPSVGPGSVLRDIIDSRAITVSTLGEIFRQSKNSKIVTNAHSINKGLFPDVTPTEEKSDFLFFEYDETEALKEKLIALVAKEIPESYQFDALEDIQVLAPMRKGIIGVEQLNHALQESLNKNQTLVNKMGQPFKINDKVMQIRNNYTKSIFNGDVGFIENIYPGDMFLTVNFDGKVVEYEFTELNELVLSYAASVHKFQGSESPCIIMPIHTSHYMLLQRNLLYTAITRAKKLVVLLGTKQAIALAVKNDKVEKRHTGLSYFLSNQA
jgi:exodeoxyribonuclease V alpha subunit